jgi:hypothetical protein
MAEASIACQYFHHLAEHQVAVCKECQYAVWPDQIEGHLQEQHKIKQKDATKVGTEVRSWAGVIQYPSEFVAASNNQSFRVIETLSFRRMIKAANAPAKSAL